MKGNFAMFDNNGGEAWRLLYGEPEAEFVPPPKLIVTCDAFYYSRGDVAFGNKGPRTRKQFLKFFVRDAE